VFPSAPTEFLLIFIGVGAAGSAPVMKLAEALMLPSAPIEFLLTTKSSGVTDGATPPAGSAAGVAAGAAAGVAPGRAGGAESSNSPVVSFFY